MEQHKEEEEVSVNANEEVVLDSNIEMHANIVEQEEYNQSNPPAIIEENEENLVLESEQQIKEIESTSEERKEESSGPSEESQVIIEEKPDDESEKKQDTENVNNDETQIQIQTQQEQEQEQEQDDTDVDTPLTSPPRNLNITFVKDFTTKPFLGGYKHKKTGIEYHHASSQTIRAPTAYEIKKSKTVKLERQTQTVDFKNGHTQTTREASTQISKPGVIYVGETPKRKDLVVSVSESYYSADELHQEKLRKALKIQCIARGWFARKKAKKLREEKAARDIFVKEQEALRMQEADEIRQKEIDRRRNPKTQEDFAILYKELQAWRVSEGEKIEKMAISAEERKQLMVELLKKQTKLLQTIDRLKQDASKKNREKAIHSNLEKIAQPKETKVTMDNSSPPIKTYITTPSSTRATELKDLYLSLKIPEPSIDDRLATLLQVKNTVNEHPCTLSNEICDLIDREADLLNRRKNTTSLEGLRKRICTLFLQFIQNPDFNPAAKNLVSKKGILSK